MKDKKIIFTDYKNYKKIIIQNIIVLMAINLKMILVFL